MELANNLQSLLADYVNQHLIIAAFLGALIGFERELAGKDPSLRTFTLICLGSCVFSMISVHTSTMGSSAHADGDPGRIAAQIVTGIGFLGAGVIFRSTRGVSGYTTAALIWLTAGIGMAVGFDRIDLAVSATVIALIFNYLLKAVHWLVRILRKAEPNHTIE